MAKGTRHMNQKSELQQYKDFVKQKLDEITECLAYISVGDFTRRFNLYEIELPAPGGMGPPDVFIGTRAELEDMVVPKASEFDLAIGNMALAVQKNATSGGFFNEEDVRRIFWETRT